MSAQPITRDEHAALLDRLTRQDSIIAGLRSDGDRLRTLNTTLYGALSKVADQIAEASRETMFKTGSDRSREQLDRTIEEVNEQLATAYQTASVPLYVAQMRHDLDGRDDVTVLAEARERLGRRV